MKDYLILSFQDNKTKNISRLLSNGRYLWDHYSEKDLPLKHTSGDGMGATEEEMFKYSDIVYSIKRLKDNIIFNIGSIVNTPYGLHSIRKFTFTDNNVVLHLTSFNSTSCSCTVLLKNAVMVEKNIVVEETQKKLDIYSNAFTREQYKIIQQMINISLKQLE